MLKGFGRIINLTETLSTRKFFLLIFLLVILTAIFWWPFYNGFEIKSDASAFHDLGINLAEGRGFYRGEYGGKTMFQEPGYPFFLALNYKIFGVRPNIVRIEQLFLVFLASCLAYLIARKIFGELAAKISGLALAIFPAFNIYGSFIQTEVLAVFLLLLFTLILFLARRKECLYIFGLAGLIFGVLALVKTIFLYLLIFLLVIFFWKLEKKKILKILVFGFGFLLIVGPWVYRNYASFGQAEICEKGGAIIWNHAIKTTYDGEQLEQLLKTVFLGEYFVKLGEPDFSLEEIDGNIIRKAELLKMEQAGKSAGEIDIIFMNQSKEMMLARPFKFFALGVLEIFLANTPVVPLNSLTQTFSDSSLDDYKFVKTGLIVFIRFCWWFFLGLVVLGLLRVLKKGKFEGLVVAGYLLFFNGIFLGMEGLPRLILPIYPYYFMLAADALVNLGKKSKLRRRIFKGPEAVGAEVPKSGDNDGEGFGQEVIHA